jgi:hypothetical protein
MKDVKVILKVKQYREFENHILGISKKAIEHIMKLDKNAGIKV